MSAVDFPRKLQADIFGQLPSFTPFADFRSYALTLVEPIRQPASRGIPVSYITSLPISDIVEPGG